MRPRVRRQPMAAEQLGRGCVNGIIGCQSPREGSSAALRSASCPSARRAMPSSSKKPKKPGRPTRFLVFRSGISPSCAPRAYMSQS